MRLQLRSIMAALVMVCVVGPLARAVDITFDFTSGVSGLSSFSKTVSGYTLQFSNPSPGATFAGDGDGLGIGYVSGGPLLNQFQIQLTAGNAADALEFKSYDVGWVRSGTEAKPFSLTGGTGSSTNNSLSSTGNFSFNGSISIAQGQTVIFSSPGTTSSNDGSQIKFMTFTVIPVPVPEPSTYALGAICAGVMALAARRRRLVALSDAG